jgi:hypothetical protein
MVNHRDSVNGVLRRSTTFKMSVLMMDVEPMLLKENSSAAMLLGVLQL